jgi:hypothetical protein
METKKLFGFVVAILAAIFAVGLVAAGTLDVTVKEVIVNDVSSLDSTNLVLSGAPGETVPVVIKFTSNANLEDVKLRVWVDGYRSDISASTAKFSTVNGSTYIKRLALTMPNVRDMSDDLTEGLTLYVRLADRNDEKETTYGLSLEKEDYAYDVLYVDAPNSASAGEIIALDVILKNVGAEELEDSFVTASIPELGISKKAYFGDLQAQDNEADNMENARERRLYLVIPSDVESGDYTLEVRASNYDTSSIVKKVISVTGLTVSNDTDTIDANGNKEGLPTSILVLTIVLVIIFVVLLVVLIVLLTKKPSERTEDFGETSYY